MGEIIAFEERQISRLGESVGGAISNGKTCLRMDALSEVVMCPQCRPHVGLVERYDFEALLDKQAPTPIEGICTVAQPRGPHGLAHHIPAVGDLSGFSHGF